MAAHTAYPTKAEVDAYLATLPNLTVPAAFDTDPTIRAAIAEWERLTEYRPFLSGTAASRTFDPPGPKTTRPTRGGGRTLRLGAGLVSLSSLTVGVEGGSAGTALTLDTDFWLWPANAAALSRPYTAIEFACVQWGQPRSIVINGVWGYGATIPDDAWKAVRDLAAADAMREIREGLGLGSVEVKDDEVTIRSSIELLGSLGQDLASRASKVAIAYRLMS
jgi:hypothetical protein